MKDMRRALGRGVLESLLVVIVVLASVWISTNSRSPERHLIRPKANLTESHILKRSEPGGYVADDYLSFSSFPDDNDMEKGRVIRSVLEVQQMLVSAIGILQAEKAKSTPDDPSFLRYFQTGDIDVVSGVLDAILAYIGGSGKQRHECLNLPKLELYYGDPYFLDGNDRLCQNPNNNAYENTDDDGTGNYWIGLRPPFFNPWRSTSQIDPAIVGASADLSCGNYWQNPLASSSLTLLHELIHASPVYTTITNCPGNTGNRITDLWIIARNRKAYGAFYSMGINKGIFQGTVDMAGKLQAGLVSRPYHTRNTANECQTCNDENYMWMVAEMWYRDRIDKDKVWADPPDPQDPQAQSDCPPASFWQMPQPPS